MYIFIYGVIKYKYLNNCILKYPIKVTYTESNTRFVSIKYKKLFLEAISSKNRLLTVGKIILVKISMEYTRIRLISIMTFFRDYFDIAIINS